MLGVGPAPPRPAAPRALSVSSEAAIGPRSRTSLEHLRDEPGRSRCDPAHAAPGLVARRGPSASAAAAGARPAAATPRGPSTRTAAAAPRATAGRAPVVVGPEPAEGGQVVRALEHVDRVDLQQPTRSSTRRRSQPRGAAAGRGSAKPCAASASRRASAAESPLADGLTRARPGPTVKAVGTRGEFGRGAPRETPTVRRAVPPGPNSPPKKPGSISAPDRGGVAGAHVNDQVGAEVRSIQALSRSGSSSGDGLGFAELGHRGAR